jgi:hypothetical protein
MSMPAQQTRVLFGVTPATLWLTACRPGSQAPLLKSCSCHAGTYDTASFWSSELRKSSDAECQSTPERVHRCTQHGAPCRQGAFMCSTGDDWINIVLARAGATLAYVIRESTPRGRCGWSDTAASSPLPPRPRSLRSRAMPLCCHTTVHYTTDEACAVAKAARRTAATALPAVRPASQTRGSVLG